MEKQRKTVFFFIFISLSFSLSFSSPLHYQTFIPTSLPHPQTLTWQSDEHEALPLSESNFSIDLHHVDNLSPALNSTPESLFKLRLHRDAVRVNALSAIAAGNGKRKPPRDFSSSIISGLAQGSGEYFTRLGVGTPTRYVYMILDTGSDVVWVQCSPCRKCYTQSDPVFDPKKSTSFLGVSCASPHCRQLDSSGCNNRRKCLYQVSYGDGSFTLGEFSTKTLTFRKNRVKNVALGCGHDNEGLFVGAAGLLGLGRGKLSFPKQAGRRFDRKYSYCLVDRTTSSKPSAILFGESSVSRTAVFNPLLTNPKLDTFYYVGLTGVSVGGVRVPGVTPSLFKLDKAGNGGVIVDSGTSVTRLTRPAYIALRNAFRAGASGLKRSPEFSAAAIKCLIGGHVSKHSLHSILEYSLSWYLGGKQNLWGAAAQVLGLRVETIGKGFQAHLDSVPPVMRSILQSAMSAVTSNSLQDSSDDAVVPLVMFEKILGQFHNLFIDKELEVLGLRVETIGKGFQAHLDSVLPVMRSILQSAMSAVTSNSLQDSSDDAVVPLVMFEKILGQFHNMFIDKELEDIWETICDILLHPHLWLRNISCRILPSYFSRVTVACKENHKASTETFFLMKPRILFHIAVSLCCQLKVPSTDEAAGIVTMQNLVFSICGLQSFLDKNGSMDASTFWPSLDLTEQDRFLKAFSVLDPRKGRRNVDSLISDASGQHNKHQHPFISYLLQRLAKITFHRDVVNQMKIVFNCYKSISPKLLGDYSPSMGDGLHSYAYQLLLPLYRVGEGYAGKVITDDLKQFAQEVSESIRDIIGEVQNFVQIYSEIRKNLKAKRDKRKQEEKIMAVVNPARNASEIRNNLKAKRDKKKQEEKIMAVVNPARNAKRKLRNAAKHRDHKRRKIMTMRMGRRI